MKKKTVSKKAEENRISSDSEGLRSWLFKLFFFLFAVVLTSKALDHFKCKESNDPDDAERGLADYPSGKPAGQTKKNNESKQPEKKRSAKTRGKSATKRARKKTKSKKDPLNALFKSKKKSKTAAKKKVKTVSETAEKNHIKQKKLPISESDLKPIDDDAFDDAENDDYYEYHIGTNVTREIYEEEIESGVIQEYDDEIEYIEESEIADENDYEDYEIVFEYVEEYDESEPIEEYEEDESEPIESYEEDESEPIDDSEEYDEESDYLDDNNDDIDPEVSDEFFEYYDDETEDDVLPDHSSTIEFAAAKKEPEFTEGSSPAEPESISAEKKDNKKTKAKANDKSKAKKKNSKPQSIDKVPLVPDRSAKSNVRLSVKNTIISTAASLKESAVKAAAASKARITSSGAKLSLADKVSGAFVRTKPKDKKVRARRIVEQIERPELGIRIAEEVPTKLDILRFEVEPRRKKRITKKKIRRRAISLLLKLSIFSVGLIILFGYIFGLSRNQSLNMQPAFRDGDLMFYFRMTDEYSANDTVLINYEKKSMPERVIAVAGDTVDITESGLLVNGGPVEENYAWGKTTRFENGVEFPLTVPEGSIFVLGDNREHATDSRVLGCISEEDVRGSIIGAFRRRNF